MPHCQPLLRETEGEVCAEKPNSGDKNENACTVWNAATDNYTMCPLRKEGFFRLMTDDSLVAYEKVSSTSWYPDGAVLFVEGQVPRGAYMLCQGRVKQIMASPEGKTIIMRVAEAGELLALDSVVSGEAHGVTTETLQPCQVDFVRREDFLKLLHEYPGYCGQRHSAIQQLLSRRVPADSLSWS